MTAQRSVHRAVVDLPVALKGISVEERSCAWNEWCR